MVKMLSFTLGIVIKFFQSFVEKEKFCVNHFVLLTTEVYIKLKQTYVTYCINLKKKPKNKLFSNCVCKISKYSCLSLKLSTI